MLIAVLKRASWPFDRSRLWLSAPLILGATAIAIGCELLTPFIFGYDAPPSISFTSVASCTKGAHAYAVALSPTRFVVAIAPNVDEVTADSTGRFLSVANNLQIQRGPQLSFWGDFCKTWDFEIATEEGVDIQFAGAYVGSLFLSQVNDHVFDGSLRQHLGYAPIGVNDPGVKSEYIWDAKLNLRINAIENSLFIQRHKAGIVYKGATSTEQSPQGVRKKTTFRVEAIPQKVSVPAGNMSSAPIDFNKIGPPVPVSVGITGAVFVVDCAKCKGREGYGTQLAISINHWNDWDWGFMDGSEDSNRLIAATSPLWTSIPNPDFHARREQIGKHWWSLGSPHSETSSFADSRSETTDVFRWERRGWLDREQSITLFASLLLGLGVTLWTEVLIVFLHSVSPPSLKSPSKPPQNLTDSGDNDAPQK
jgi:hypothetical protein